MPARESRRIAANRSTFDIGAIGRLPSRPADAPTSQGGTGTREHRKPPERCGLRTGRQTPGQPRDKAPVTPSTAPAPRTCGCVILHLRSPLPELERGTTLRLVDESQLEPGA